MHENVRNIELRYGTKHLRIHFASRNIIDNIGAIFLYSHSGHISSESVDTNGELRRKFVDYLQTMREAAHLFLGGNIISPRARTICSNVDHLCAFVHHLLYTSVDFLVGLFSALCKERIRRYV